MPDYKSNALDNSIMHGWALNEMAPWLLRPVSKDRLKEEFRKLNTSEPSVFIYSIIEGQITIHEKPESARNWNFEANFSRAKSYKMYLESVIKKIPFMSNTQLAIFVDDGALDNQLIPIFSFQKPKGSQSILLPDPDMMGRDFPVANDKILFKNKKCRAIFAGGSSGGKTSLTIADVKKDGAIPRIRVAEFFKGNPDVIFKIPIIVQYDSEETVEYLKEKGYGDGKSIPWSEQLDNKFLISIDGNGATCTRVSITLSSNSILLKYYSDSILYYFQGLSPWVHYIPINKNTDVIDIVDLEKNTPGYFDAIYVAAQNFAKSYLTREATFCYTAHLLNIYSSKINFNREDSHDKNNTSIGILAHVQNHGDIRAKDDGWAGVIGSGCPIEGFSLWPTGGICYQDLSYQVFDVDNKPLNLVAGGQFAGSAGQSRPIYGLQICLANCEIGSWKLNMSVRFIDGFISTVSNTKNIIVNSRNIPIEGFLLKIIKD